MFRLFLVMTTAATLVASPATAQEVQYGSIAVVPFGSVVQSEQALESARVMTGAVEQGLRDSGRFVAVLERSAEMDAAIQAELEHAESGDSFESAIRINTESQMNAKYLLSGEIERYDIARSGNTYDATVSLRIRIVDVETRAVMVNEVMVITNELLNNKRGLGGLGGLGGLVSRAVGARDTSAEDAINHVHENATDEIRKVIAENVSLLLVDYDVDADDIVTELILLLAPDIDDDEELLVRFMVRNGMGGGFRPQDVGKARVTRTDSEYAYAEITEGRDEITAAVKEDAFRLVILPENN